MACGQRRVCASLEKQFTRIASAVSGDLAAPPGAAGGRTADLVPREVLGHIALLSLLRLLPHLASISDTGV